MAEKIYIPKDKNLLDPKVDSTFKTLFIQEGQRCGNLVRYRKVGYIFKRQY